MTYDEARAALDEKLNQLGTDEVRVLDCVAARLVIGEKCYGKLDLRKDRDWKKEASEEALDLAVYLSALTLSDGK